MTDDARVVRLVNLLARGRVLQYENTSVLVARVTRRHPGARANALADLVYTSTELMFTFLFIEERAYLDDATYDRFTDAVFALATGPRGPRAKALIDTYAGALPDFARVSSLVADDLSAALLGAPAPDVARALTGTARSLKKLSELYVAMAFDDQAMVKRLS
jgi:hypothetical protein